MEIDNTRVDSPERLDLFKAATQEYILKSYSKNFAFKDINSRQITSDFELPENEFHTAELLTGLHSYGIKINLRCDKSFSKPNASKKDPHTIFSMAHAFDSYSCSAFSNGEQTLPR
jgi:hypothetical protein